MANLILVVAAAAAAVEVVDYAPNEVLNKIDLFLESNDQRLIYEHEDLRVLTEPDCRSEL